MTMVTFDNFEVNFGETRWKNDLDNHFGGSSLINITFEETISSIDEETRSASIKGLVRWGFVAVEIVDKGTKGRVRLLKL